MKHLFAWGLLVSTMVLGACTKEKLVIDSYSTMRYDVLGLTTPADTMALNTVDFVSARQGFVGGADGALFATTDGAQTWTRRPQPALGTICKLLFTTATAGWAGTNTGLYRTADGGQTWRYVPTYDPRGSQGTAVCDLQFVTPQVGYAVGSGGSINKTTDGGATWQPVQRVISTIFGFTGVSFTSADSGTVVGENQARWTTTDGGRQWTKYDYSGRANDTNHDVLCFRAGGYLLAGPEGFQSFETASSGYGSGPDQAPLGAVYGLASFGLAGPVVAVGERTVIRQHPGYSQDADRSAWVNVRAPDGTSLGKGARFRAADFADAATFYAVGPRGTLYRFHYQ